MKINDAIFGIALLLLGIVILLHVRTFPTIPGQQYGPALFPGTVAAGLVVCGVLLTLSGLRDRGTQRWVELAPWLGSRPHVVAFLLLVGGVVAYIALADAVGFLLLAPMLLFVWFVALRLRVLPAAVTAVVVTALIWYAFYKLLRVPLPWGVLQPYAF